MHLHVQVKCLDYDASGNHDLIGEFITSYNELTSAFAAEKEVPVVLLSKVHLHPLTACLGSSKPKEVEEEEIHKLRSCKNCCPEGECVHASKLVVLVAVRFQRCTLTYTHI